MADPKFKVGDVLKYTDEWLINFGIKNVSEKVRVKVIQIDFGTYTFEVIYADNYNFYDDSEADEIDNELSADYIDSAMEKENTLEQYVLDTLKKHGVI